MKKVLMRKFDLVNFSKYRTELMGLAIILVVFHHLTFKSNSSLIGKGYMFFRVTGAMGVDMFLFLSGIGLFYSYSRNSNIIMFYKKRVLRIIPTYLIICAPFYAYTYLIGQSMNVKEFFLHLTLVSYWVNGTGDWYIAAIIILYILFPLFNKIINKNGIFGFLLLIFIWSMICLFLVFLFPNLFHNTETFWPRIPIFIFGIYIGQLILNKRQVNGWVLINSILANIIILGIEAYYCLQGAEAAYSFWPRLFYFPLSISFIFIVCYIFDSWSLVKLKKSLNLLGGVTLEIYLLNQRFINLFDALIKNVYLSNFIGIVLTVIVSFIINRVMRILISLPKHS